MTFFQNSVFQNHIQNQDAKIFQIDKLNNRIDMLLHGLSYDEIVLLDRE